MTETFSTIYKNLADANCALAATIAVRHALCPPAQFAGPISRGQFVREVADEIAAVEAAFAAWRLAHVRAAYEASEGEDAIAGQAFDALDMLKLNVEDELLPPLQLAAAKLLGEYGD